MRRVLSPYCPTAMTTITKAVHLLPIFYPILIVVTIFTPYIIAVSLDHVYPFLPSISKTAGFEPEGSIFGFLMFLVALFGLLALFTRYLQLKGISQQGFEKDVLHKVKWFNTISLPPGVLGILGVVMVANFRSSVNQVSSGHNLPSSKILIYILSLIYLAGFLSVFCSLLNSGKQK